MKLIPVFVLVALATMCIVSGGQSKKDADADVYLIDKATHQLKKVPAGRGIPTYSHGPIEDTLNYKRCPDGKGCQGEGGRGGCSCAFDSAAFHSGKEMTVSPTNIVTTVGQDVTVNYDASLICYGQTIDNMDNVDSPDPRAPDKPTLNLGSVDWQVLQSQSLPREWGTITLPGGYTQAGSYTINFQFTVKCVDRGPANCSNSCSTHASIPVTVH
jgi:hypothetical protein